jgi:hypothetical protein
MNIWQLSMAAGLTGSTIAGAVMGTVARRRSAPVARFLPPVARFAMQHAYLVALVPLSEAFVLWMGKWWG